MYFTHFPTLVVRLPFGYWDHNKTQNPMWHLTLRVRGMNVVLLNI